MQAESQLEDYILSQAADEFYLKDIPLTEDDCKFINHMIAEYSKTIYSFDDYRQVLLLFIVHGYLIARTGDTKTLARAMFFNNTSHIPQHHMRHLVYLIVNLFMELDIANFGMTCTSLEDVINIVRKHAEL